MEILKEINWNYEASIMITRYFYKRLDKNRMVTYLSRFRVDKDEIKEIYKNYDLYMDKIFCDLDKINFASYFDFDLNRLVEPIFKNYSLLETFYKFYDMTKSQDINFFFSMLLSYYQPMGEKRRDISCISDLINEMNNFRLNDNEKMTSMSFYSNYEGYLKKINEPLEIVKGLLSKYYYLVSDKVTEFQSLLNSDYVNQFLVERRLPNEKIKVFLNIFEYSVWSYDELDFNYLGFNYMYHIIKKINDDKKKSEELAVLAFKALGDNNRYELVKILSIKKKMYVQQIANFLELSPATILHHIDILKKAGLLENCVDSIDNKRVYYQLNSSMLDLLSVNLLDMIGGK